MKIDVIDLYKNEFKQAYIVNNKDCRKRVILIGKDNKTRKGMTLARYRYEEAYGRIPGRLQVDHINNDKTDDRLENLQLLTARDNTIKGHAPARVTVRTCPICGKQFNFFVRDLSTHPNPCCSRHCGRMKQAQLLRERKLKGSEALK